MGQLVEVMELEDGQVLVPELNRGIEYQPGLLGFAAKFDSSDDMIDKFLFLRVESVNLFIGEFSVVLVAIECH